MTILYSIWVANRYDFKYSFSIQGAKFYIAASHKTRQKLFISKTADAFAIGNKVFIRSKRIITNELIAHELEHVFQFRKFLDLFAILYWVETQMKSYYRNRFERQARKAAKLAPYAYSKVVEDL